MLSVYVFQDGKNRLYIFFKDIDECVLLLFVCSANSHCANDFGGYHCVCNDGFFGRDDENLCQGACHNFLYFILSFISLPSISLCKILRHKNVEQKTDNGFTSPSCRQYGAVVLI